VKVLARPLSATAKEGNAASTLAPPAGVTYAVALHEPIALDAIWKTTSTR
jgi:hypothetical protein